MFNRFILGMLLILSCSLTIAGCGGSGSTNGTLTITAPATVTAGKSFQATANFSSPKGVQAMPVSFTASDPAIIAGSEADTNSAGVATVQLLAANIINADKTVRITAQAGGLTSSATVTIKANKLTFNAPAAGTQTATAGSPVTFFFTGTPLVTYTNADGEYLGSIKEITLRVYNKTSGVNNVLWQDNLTTETYLAVNPKTFQTDTTGSLPFLGVLVSATAPAAGTTSDYAVDIELSVTDPNFEPIVKHGLITFSITGQ